MYVCVCVCVYVCACAHACKRQKRCVYVYMHACACAHVCMCTNVNLLNGIEKYRPPNSISKIIKWPPHLKVNLLIALIFASSCELLHFL